MDSALATCPFVDFIDKKAGDSVVLPFFDSKHRSNFAKILTKTVNLWLHHRSRSYKIITFVKKKSYTRLFENFLLSHREKLIFLLIFDRKARNSICHSRTLSWRFDVVKKLKFQKSARNQIFNILNSSISHFVHLQKIFLQMKIDTVYCTTNFKKSQKIAQKSDSPNSFSNYFAAKATAIRSRRFASRRFSSFN